ncbi:MAG: NADP-dependent oxidoreductase [Bryobacteraceae bacterium]
MEQKRKNTMRAAALDRFGGPDTITLQMLPIPEVGPDEVLIRVESAGVAQWDPYEREGGFAEIFGIKPKFPYVLGSDGAGTIAAAGKQASRFKEGDRVYAAALANPKGGFYAEYAVVKEESVSPVPKKLTTEQAGVMLSDALTALRGLDDILGLKRGETLMVFGASGGVGHIAVQLAKRMGARVLALASGDDGVALAKRLGADAVVNGRRDEVASAARNFAPDGLDAAFVTAGGEAADRALEAVRNGGRAAHPNGVTPEPKTRPDIQLSSYDVVIDRGSIEKLNRYVEEGPFEVHVARSFSLDQAAEAHRALEEHYLGKLALRLV